MMYLSLKVEETYKNQHDYALSAVQVAAYNSSEKLLKSLLLIEPPVLYLYISNINMLGFTYWRKRRFRDALSIYITLLKVYELLQTEWKSIPDENVETIIAGAAREYLETLVEIVNDKRQSYKRSDVVRNSKANYVISILKRFELKTNYYLNQIALMEIRYWLGTTVSFDDARSLFEECMAMQEWEAAALTAQFMLTLSIDGGKIAVKEILPQLRKRGSTKLILKVNARLIYEQTHHRIPVQILNLKAFRNILLLGTELIFAFKRLTWDLDCLIGQIRVETGFFSMGHIVSKNK